MTFSQNTMRTSHPTRPTRDHARSRIISVTCAVLETIIPRPQLELLPAQTPAVRPPRSAPRLSQCHKPSRKLSALHAPLHPPHSDVSSGAPAASAHSLPSIAVVVRSGCPSWLPGCRPPSTLRARDAASSSLSASCSLTQDAEGPSLPRNPSARTLLRASPRAPLPRTRSRR